MNTASRTGCQLLVVAVCLTATAPAASHKPPTASPNPPTENARGPNDGPTLPTPRKQPEHSGSLTSRAPRTPKPTSQRIVLSGRLRRPSKWSPQLELFPPGQIKRFDLRGKLLRDIKAGTPIRVRGVVRSSLHRGGTKDNPSAFPAQWIIWLEVTDVEILDDPRDVLKKDVGRAVKPAGQEDQTVSVKKELARMAGRWRRTEFNAVGSGARAAESFLHGGKDRSLGINKPYPLLVKGTTFLFAGTPAGKAAVKIDPTKSPKTIDLTDAKARTWPGIYKLDGDELIINLGLGKERPATIKRSGTFGQANVVYKRAEAHNRASREGAGTSVSDSAKDVPENWFRDAPFPGLGQPQQKRKANHFVRLAAHPHMQRDMDADTGQQKKLKEIYQAAVKDGVELFARWGEEFEMASPLEAERKARELEKRTVLVWEAAKLRAEAFLTAKQIQRIRQIMVQRMGQKVFFDRDYAAKLKLVEQQRDTLEMKWKEHLQRVKKNGVNGKQSYRRFWSDAYKVLTDKQRRALDKLRGPPLKDDGKTSAAPKTDGADVIGTVFGKPVSSKDIRKDVGLHDELARLFLMPVLKKYRAAHPKQFELTEKEIARAIRYHEQRVKQKGGNLAASWRRITARQKAHANKTLEEIRQKLKQSDLKDAERNALLKRKREKERLLKQPGRLFVQHFYRNLKFQQYLYRKYGGGRVLFQQFGNEAFDAMHRWLKKREKEGDFEITNAKLQAKFYEYWTNTKMHGAFLSTPKDKTDPVQLRFPWERVRKE